MPGAAAVLKTTLGNPPAGSSDKSEQDAAKQGFLNLLDQLPRKNKTGSWMNLKTGMKTITMTTSSRQRPERKLN